MFDFFSSSKPADVASATNSASRNVLQVLIDAATDPLILNGDEPDWEK